MSSLRSGSMSPNHLNNFTILIVEDHDAVRRYLGNFLRHFGAVVVVATNASEGLQAVRTYKPALVLSDIAMPGRDGFGLIFVSDAAHHQLAFTSIAGG